MKKGFTLIELLAVIVIIAVISLIVFPMVTGYINNSKEKLCSVQVKDIEDAAKKWATENTDKLDKYHINDIYVTVDYLKYQKYLEKDAILEPKTKEQMNGCVLIHYDSNIRQYSYTYLNYNLKDSNDIDKLESEAFIIYYYDDDMLFDNLENRDYEYTPFYDDVINNNTIRVDGETEDGLYDLGNKYVFRGSNINNYVNYGGKTYRILSIDKNDYSMTLLSTGTATYGAWSNGEIDFTKTDLKDTLKFDNLPLLNTNWLTADLLDSNIDINELESKFSTKIDVEVGLMSVYDYVSASTNSDCALNISNNCSSDNYLYNYLTNNGSNGVWTMTTNGEDKVWSISNSGNLELVVPDSHSYYYNKVIKIPINVYLTDENDTGSSDHPYELSYSSYEPGKSTYCKEKGSE